METSKQILARKILDQGQELLKEDRSPEVKALITRIMGRVALDTLERPIGLFGESNKN